MTDTPAIVIDHGPCCMVCGERLASGVERCNIPDHCPGGFHILGTRPHCFPPSSLAPDEHDHGASIMYRQDLVSGDFHIRLDGKLAYIDRRA